MLHKKGYAFEVKCKLVDFFKMFSKEIWKKNADYLNKYGFFAGHHYKLIRYQEPKIG